MKKQWLRDWPWQTVVTINAVLCKEKKALHKPRIRISPLKNFGNNLKPRIDVAGTLADELKQALDDLE